MVHPKNESTLRYDAADGTNDVEVLVDINTGNRICDSRAICKKNERHRHENTKNPKELNNSKFLKGENSKYQPDYVN